MSKNLQNRLAAHTPNAAQQAINTMIERVEKHFANKEVDEAFAVLAEAEEHYPDQPQIAYLVGKYTAEKKSPRDGIKKLEEVLERFPDHLSSLLELGNIYLKPGDTRRATPFFRKAMELAPENPSCYISMGALNQRKGDLPLAVENYRKGIELQLKHPISNDEPERKDDFRVTDAEKLLWDTLKLMADNGVHMFPTHGTLLGLVRDGGLFTHDKDIDTTIPFSEMNRAIRILQNNGWQEINGSFGYISPRAMLNKKSGITMDVAGTVIDETSKKAITGTWMAGIPKEWNILREFESIKLEKRPTPDGKSNVWFLKKPEAWLDAIYGDWKTPDKNFDTMICGKNSRSFSPLLQCFAYSRIFSSWTANNIPRALSLTRATLDFSPQDSLLKRVLSRLESRRK